MSSAVFAMHTCHQVYVIICFERVSSFVLSACDQVHTGQPTVNVHKLDGLPDGWGTWQMNYKAPVHTLMSRGMVSGFVVERSHLTLHSALVAVDDRGDKGVLAPSCSCSLVHDMFR